MKLRGLILSIVALTILGCGQSSQTGTGQGQTPALTFKEPSIVRSANGVLETTLDMKRTLNSIGTRTVATNAYNGEIPGQTWRVKPGDTLRFRVINNMTLPVSAEQAANELSRGLQAVPPEWCAPQLDGAEPFYDLMGFQRAAMQMDPTAILTTNIHTHGLQVDPRGDGDNPFVSILPGQYKDYEIKIPENHPTGLFWYHPHVHMTTSRQGWNGLSGAIIVEGGLDDHPEISQMQERLMVVNELLLDQNGQVPFGVVLPIAGFVPFTTLPALPTDICFPVNGVDNPTVTIRPGEVQRWRLLNASPHRALELSLEGHEIYQVAQDGIHFEAPKRRDKLVVAAGNRVEFLVKAGQAGTYELLALPRDQGHPGGARPQRTILTMDVGGQLTEMSIPTTLLPSPMPDISQNSIVQQRGVQFEGGILSAPVVFKLDGQVFDANRIDNSVESGTTEEWTLVNNDVFEHPFHIHVNPFQVVKINGEPYAEPEVWWDTIFLPAKGTVTVRMRFRPDVVGKTVYHCHILPHEDNGMMSAFTLNPPGEDFPDLPTTGPFGSGEPLPLAPQPSIGGDPDRPYVFTQASDGLTAMVDQGGRVQIQLPGGPSVWSVVDVDTDKLEPLQSEVIPSPGRIEGTDSIYQFDFRKKGPESTTVTLVANPPVSWLQNPFTLTVTSRL